MWQITLFWKDLIIPVKSFSCILLFLKMDSFQSSSLALLLTKFLVDWCCAGLNTGFSFFCLYMFLLRNYIHIYAFKWHLYCNNSQIYISSMDITLELQSYVLWSTWHPFKHFRAKQKLIGPNFEFSISTHHNIFKKPVLMPFFQEMAHQGYSLFCP